MKILVTGGYGFIGSNFIRYALNNTDFEVRNIDKITYAARPESLDDIVRDCKLSRRYEFFKADITDMGYVLQEFAKDVDYIVNFAAETHVDRSIGNWENNDIDRLKQASDNAFIDTNITGTKMLLEASLRNKNLKKFLQISTDEVYGSVSKPSKESDRLNPSNPYAATKMGAEGLVNAYHITFDIPTCITRSCNNYGPWQSSEKFIPVVILRALEDQKIPVYGAGKNIRDWIYADDNSAAILKVLEKGGIGSVYNIPGASIIENKNLAIKILEILGKPLDLIQFTIDRPGHDFMYSMDGRKIKLLGFNPRYSLEEGLERTIDFYKSHKEYFRKDQERSGVLQRIDSLLRR